MPDPTFRAEQLLWKTAREGDYYKIEAEDGLLETPLLPLRGHSPFGAGWPTDEGRVLLTAAIRRSRAPKKIVRRVPLSTPPDDSLRRIVLARVRVVA